IAPKSSQAEQMAGIKLGGQPCPNAVKAPAHWAPLLGLVKGDENLVEHVGCGSLIGKSSLQALVTVRLVGGTAAYENLFVYDNIMAVKPLLLFSLFRLVQGDAKISNHNTIITSEVDPASSVNNSKPNPELLSDLHRG